MQAPQSESLEESGIIAAFVRAIAGNDARSSELGYAGLTAFLALAPEGTAPSMDLRFAM